MGANGAGKSNFIDSINFVNEALFDSLEYAVRERGGIAQLIRQTPGADPYSAEIPPLSDEPFFEIGLAFTLGVDLTGTYRVRVGQRGTDFHVLHEECVVGGDRLARSFFSRERGQVKASTEPRPLPKEDRLYLAAMASIEPFGRVFEGLTSGLVYNPDLSEIRDAQPIDSGSYLADDCWNIASVVSRLQTKVPRLKQRVETYLRRIIRSNVVLRTRRVVPYIFLEFWQSSEEKGGEALRLLASSMSDGTLRATALLLALLQPPEIDDDTPISLVAFEEPETGLHPAALRVLFDAIQESTQSRQVLFTTHSPELLDNKNLAIDSILAVEFRDGATRIGPVDRITRSVLRDGLATASELLRQTDAFRPDSPIE